MESDTARVSVLPDVGSELPTVYVGNGALDVVGLGVGPSCLRMDSEETLPALQDERSVMSFLVWPAAVLTGQFILSDEEFGEDGSSPRLHISGSLVCHVDLDSLWTAPWDDSRPLETGSRPGISIWSNVMCSISRLSRRPVLLVTGCLRSFRDLGRACVLDLNAGETYAPVWLSGGGLETVPPKPPFPPCWLVVLPSATITQVCGGSRRRGCAGNGHSPGGTLVARKDSSQGEKCAAELGFPRARGARKKRLYMAGLGGWANSVYMAGLGGWANSVCLDSDWVTPLRISPQTCTGCLRPILLCQLQFDVLAVFRCACVIAHWELYLSRHNLTKSRLCRQCSFPPWDTTWIVLVVVCLSYSLAWWRIMLSGKLPAMDQAGASSTTSAPLPGKLLGLALDLGSDRL